MTTDLKQTIIRYTFATVGLFFVALGTALSIKSNLGTSPLSAPGYVLAETGTLSVGNWTIIVNTLYLFIQIGILRKNFKSKYLLQIAATIIFGYLIDLSLFFCRFIEPTTLVSRIILIVLACFVTALGVSIEVISNAWMLSAEMTVYAIVKTIHKEFSSIKIAMDCVLLVLSSLTAYILFQNPFGSGAYEGMTGILLGTSKGVVIGLGTLMMAVLTGAMMKITDPIIDRLTDFYIERITMKP